MRDVHIVEAVRSPIGRRGGDLSTLHPGDRLGAVMKGDRYGLVAMCCGGGLGTGSIIERV